MKNLRNRTPARRPLTKTISRDVTPTRTPNRKNFKKQDSSKQHYITNKTPILQHATP
jgi:hypothetical protein